VIGQGQRLTRCPIHERKGVRIATAAAVPNSNKHRRHRRLTTTEFRFFSTAVAIAPCNDGLKVEVAAAPATPHHPEKPKIEHNVRSAQVRQTLCMISP
jgi:hypothetical protein